MFVGIGSAWSASIKAILGPKFERFAPIVNLLLNCGLNKTPKSIATDDPWVHASHWSMMVKTTMPLI